MQGKYIEIDYLHITFNTPQLVMVLKNNYETLLVFLQVV
jgi:hypothetical protein